MITIIPFRTWFCEFGIFQKPSDLEVFVDDVREALAEGHAIKVIHETVMEDAHDLMHKQLNDIEPTHNDLGIRLEHSTHHLERENKQDGSHRTKNSRNISVL